MIDVINKSYECDYSNQQTYNMWTIYKYFSGYYYAYRMTWDLGGMSATDFKDLLSEFIGYYNLEEKE